MANKKKKNRLFKGIGIIVLVLAALLIAVPLFLQDKIAQIIKDKANQSMDATLDFEDASLSLLKSFPEAYVDLKGV